MIEASPGLPWIHLADANTGALDLLARQHGFHELDVEDCRHRRQVAKVVDHAPYRFIVVKTIEYDRENHEVNFHDFDLFVLPDLLVTVAEGSTTVVSRTLERMPQEPEFHFPAGIAYLVMDYAVDEYLPVLDEVGQLIEDIEDQVLEDPSPQALQRIFRLKGVLIEFRRNTTAMREVLNHLMRGARPEQTTSLFPYYRDIYDHLVRALDFVESYRDLLNSTLDLYLSSVANRTNSVMKVLAIYGTISIPAVMLTSFYGMNVRLPLERWPHTSWLVIGVLASVTASLLLYFRKKRWL